MQLQAVADSGTLSSRHVTAPQWQTGHVYQLAAVINDTNSQLFLDGQLIGSVQGGFQPFARNVIAAEIPSWASAPAAYVVTQSSLQIDDFVTMAEERYSMEVAPQ